MTWTYIALSSPNLIDFCCQPCCKNLVNIALLIKELYIAKSYDLTKMTSSTSLKLVWIELLLMTEIFRKFLEKRLCQCLFLNDVSNKLTLAQMLSCKFCKTFKNTFFYGPPPMSAFALSLPAVQLWSLKSRKTCHFSIKCSYNDGIFSTLQTDLILHISFLS